MRQLILALILLFPHTLLAQGNDPEYNALVDEMLEITGALAVSEQMSALMIEQMGNVLRAQGNDLPKRAFDIMADEVSASVSESIASGEFQKMMYPIYAKYLSKADLEAAIAFYRTPAGKRIARATPLMAQEGMLVGQQWGQTLGAEIGRRVMKRLEAAGYSL
ncbi:MAG: DUF2059 domain-containing protein [Pseudomonadota bacterium]